jgi:4'-phosphopantetheinyl transferase
MNPVYWFEQTIADVPPGHSWLSGNELDRLHALRFPKRREDWLLGRWTVKNAAALFLGIPAPLCALQDIEVRPSFSGAPKLFFRDEPVRVSLSLTHRSGHGACALTQPDVLLGCDIESIEPHSHAFACDYFTVEEQQLVAHAPTEDRSWILSLLWSAKESALKALAEGLRLDTRDVVVNFPERANIYDEKQVNSARRNGDWSPLQVSRTNGQIFYGWWNRNGDLLRTVLTSIPSAVQLALPHREQFRN